MKRRFDIVESGPERFMLKPVGETRTVTGIKMQSPCNSASLQKVRIKGYTPPAGRIAEIDGSQLVV